jgi:hypothetical protein
MEKTLGKGDIKWRGHRAGGLAVDLDKSKGFRTEKNYAKGTQ